MFFATEVSSTAYWTMAVAVFYAARFATSAAPPSPDENIENKTTAPVYYCDDSSHCPSGHGFNRCENHLCMCDENFYRVYNSTSNQSSCFKCSLFQESCALTHCCQNSQATFCVNNVCMCKPGMEDECLGRYTPTLGIQLANTLSVSFAFVFLAITFVAVVRKMFRCSFFRCDSLSRVSSNSSLNEFVKQKMQNRPPVYDDIEKDRKVPTENNVPPPAYSTLNFDRPSISSYCGRAARLNPTFSISDDVDMLPPPNYSTFTTVTNHHHHHPVTGRAANNEIILTQPIYENSPLRRT
ncbi:Hypothetical protein CINCED_3A022212 [Cinara cedri]|uniref:Uncharacterized protein n=1 Tax=Cinara cedri TaxID=506608 RepID=A0A5E4MDS1_9HEMI|nr:Hypothetical protein CINCED_3A022212 [Cinara cedri]